jgi:TolA-binding protein
MPEQTQSDEILASLGRLHARLDDTNSEIAELHGEVQRQIGVCQGCQEKIQRCFTDLHGNGREGVIATQARHDQTLGELERKVSRLGVPARSLKRSNRASLGAIILAILTALASLFSWLAGADGQILGDRSCSCCRQLEMDRTDT